MHKCSFNTPNFVSRIFYKVLISKDSSDNLISHNIKDAGKSDKLGLSDFKPEHGTRQGAFKIEKRLHNKCKTIC